MDKVVVKVAALASASSVAASVDYASWRTGGIEGITFGDGTSRQPVTPQLFDTLYGYYKFTDKAIWACSLDAPMSTHVVREAVNVATLGNAPPLEHWAFVARGTVKIAEIEKVAYFVAQLASGQSVPTADEAFSDEDKFRARLIEDNKDAAGARDTAKKDTAKSIIQSDDFPYVWIEKPKSRNRSYILKDDLLERPNFSTDDWTKMTIPLSLKEINSVMYQTTCAGRPYSLPINNCQHIARQMYERCI